jgi:hypothetical protein
MLPTESMQSCLIVTMTGRMSPLAMMLEAREHLHLSRLLPTAIPLGNGYSFGQRPTEEEVCCACF